MTDQPADIVDDPTSRKTFTITPALVRDVAVILVQQGWEISLTSAYPQAQKILERVKEDVDAQGLVLVTRPCQEDELEGCGCVIGRCRIAEGQEPKGRCMYPVEHPVEGDLGSVPL